MGPGSSINTEQQGDFKEVEQNFFLNKWGLILSVVFLIILVAITIFWFMLSQTPDKKIDPFIDLKGTVYLTLAQKNDNAAGLYTLDMKTRIISRFRKDNFVKYTSRVSPDGKKVAYTASPLDRDSKVLFPYSKFLQVYVQDIDSTTVNKLTDTRTASKRLSDWSPDGQRIAFTAQWPGIPREDFFIPDEWGIGVVDLDGNMKRIDAGVSPFWSPDGSKLFYLKNDGFYIYNFNNGTSTRVWKLIEGEVSTSMKLDISDDGSLLALSVAGSRKLVLFKIVSWGPFQLKKIHTIDTGDNAMFWPVFSPDNRYLIAQEVKVGKVGGKLVDPILVVYNLETLDRMELLSLDGYNFDVAFTTDWRY